MKKLGIIMIVLFSVFMVNAQQVDISTLSPELQNQITQEKKKNDITADIKTYSEWAGMGKEIGVAVKDGLSALTDEVGKISETNVGKLTMVLIAWKVIGDDLRSLVFGPILFIFITLIYLYLRKKWYGIKKIKIVERVTEGPFWNKKVIKPAEYKVIDPNYQYSDDDWFITGKLVSGIAYAIFVIVIVANIL